MRVLTALLLTIYLSGPTLAQNAAADSTGLPGDHFSLEGALELFKNAKTLEAFEQALNAEDQRVNNLDLDGNGEVDYVRVVDHAEGDAHAIALQVPVTKSETQDVAVIELEKNGTESALLQIRGAEELYGSEVIIEPFEEKDEVPTMKGPAPPEELPRVRIWVNVWAWPCVTWIYAPNYVVWNSPYYWGYYPPRWRPWRPWGWSAWHGWHRPYHGWYQPVHTCRVLHAHGVYQHRAMHSPTVRARTAAIRTTRAATRPKQVKDQPKPARIEPAPAPKPNSSMQGSNGGKRSAAKPTKRPAKKKGSAPNRTKGQ